MNEVQGRTERNFISQVFFQFYQKISDNAIFGLQRNESLFRIFTYQKQGEKNTSCGMFEIVYNMRMCRCVKNVNLS